MDAIACGDCFRWAVQDAAEQGGTVVHGVVTEPSSSPPHRYEHAWVERGGTVFDWQTMEAQHGGKYRGKGYPLDVFYELYTPEGVVKYTAGEAVGEAARTGHYGPWDPGVARNPDTDLEAPGIHELHDAGGVTLRYRVPKGRPETPTPKERWIRPHPYMEGEFMPGYYVWDPSLSIDEMLARWADHGVKVYNGIDDSFELPTGEYFEGIYSWQDLWPHRRDDRPVNPALVEGLKEHGWLAPVLLILGRNQCVELGEGNHRLRAAKELDLQYVPVRFMLVQQATCPSPAERRERARSYELTRAHEEREAAIPKHIRFYEESGLRFNPRSSRDRLAEAFDEAFDTVEERFDDFGTAELHEDEDAGADNGAGPERQFAYCRDGNPIIIAFAPKAERLPDSHLRGLMRHEFGHALEYRYGVEELERRLGMRLPEKVERRADVVAEAVFGEPINYDDAYVQCVGVSGTSPRPSHLPDEVETLKANPVPERDNRDGKKLIRALKRLRKHYPYSVEASEVALESDLSVQRIRALISKYPRQIAKHVGTKVNYHKSTYAHGDRGAAIAEPFQPSRAGGGQYYQAMISFGEQ